MEQILLNWGHVIASLHGGFVAIATVTLGFAMYLFVYRKAIDWNSSIKAIAVGAGSFLFSGLMGLLLFPKFRMAEGMYIDPSAPWMTALFDMREWLVVLGIFLAILLFLYLYFFEIEQEAKPIKQAVLNISFFLFIVALSITSIIFLLMIGKLMSGTIIP